MKCTIESIRNIKLSDDRFGSRIEGFIPMEDTSIIPEHIVKWMANYEGVKSVRYVNGIYVASWAETTCSPKDTYDEIKGAHIAESKSKAKIYRFIRNFSSHMSDYFDSLSNYYQEAYLKYDHCVDHEEAHSNHLGNENND